MLLEFNDKVVHKRTVPKFQNAFLVVYVRTAKSFRLPTNDAKWICRQTSKQLCNLSTYFLRHHKAATDVIILWTYGSETWICFKQHYDHYNLATCHLWNNVFQTRYVIV